MPLLHVLLKIVIKCLVTPADTARDAKPITARSCEPVPISALTCSLRAINDVIHIAATLQPERKHVTKSLKRGRCRITSHISPALHICSWANTETPGRYAW